MDTESTARAAMLVEPAKRPYAAPALVVHGDVQTLTLTIKTGTDPDNDGAGSFIPDGSG